MHNVDPCPHTCWALASAKYQRSIWYPRYASWRCICRILKIRSPRRTWAFKWKLMWGRGTYSVWMLESRSNEYGIQIAVWSSNAVLVEEIAMDEELSRVDHGEISSGVRSARKFECVAFTVVCLAAFVTWIVRVRAESRSREQVLSIQFLTSHRPSW
jgi:hypothetical protein